jgi:hypothetical protein
MRTKNINNNTEQENEDLNIRGRPKKGVVSFQCEMKLWREFDHKVEQDYGKYKKSLIIEELIRKFMLSNKKISDKDLL